MHCAYTKMHRLVVVLTSYVFVLRVCMRQRYDKHPDHQVDRL